MQGKRPGTGTGPIGLLMLCTAAAPVAAQDFRAADWPSQNMFNVPGVIETPVARTKPDGEISTTLSTFGGMSRFQFAAQLHPRIMGGFRYTEIKDFNAAGFETYYDRSFDLRFTLIEETPNRPALTVGLQDFIGTGIYSAEYLVMSKQVFDRFEISAGLGWGRLAGNAISSGFGERPENTPEQVAEGGEANVDQLFRGDIGAFGGIQYRVNDALVLKAEYSSDSYDLESDDLGVFDHASPYNFGLTYQLTEETAISASYMYGSEFGVQLTFNFNPNRPIGGGSLDPAPLPITPRPPRAANPGVYSTGWSESAATRDAVRDRLAEVLILDRLELEGLDLQPGAATLYLRNSGYQASAQAMGRAARLMAMTLPSSIETFTIVPMEAGMAMPAYMFRRADLERYEVAADGSERILAAAAVDENPARPRQDAALDTFYPRFGWGLSPYMRTSFFDPDNPLRFQVGLQVGAAYEAQPGLILSGTVRKAVAGTLANNNRESDSQLPHVRSDFPLYDKNADPGIESLTATQYARVADDLYGRVTAGYLEMMYAGVSAELLWAPFDADYAFGLELDRVRQRDYEGGFGLLDYEVWTGFASVYYQVTPDYLAQVDVGQYLAGDRGATFTLQRTFANGWRLGAFATFTDVSSEEFGEGSFDKGIMFSAPLGWFFGKSSPQVPSFTIRPLQRDGGARVDVDGRLHGVVDRSRQHNVEEQWGRFWR